jgi:TetR/AcrR family transcriptional regulator, regulator of cefoperazone and chloramphenicol sensitivity
MVTPLEKARKDPDSMKARILKKARRIFGEYGFHGATTRMIAEEVGIDISTLYYHWGEKSDLYEAVVLDINEDLKEKLVEVERSIRGLPLATRMNIAIDRMTDYLFENREISNLVLFRYFGKTRDASLLDFQVPEFVSEIARSMGLCRDKVNVPKIVRMHVLAMMNAIHNFVSGEDFFRSMLSVERDEYVSMVKDTLKYILLPAFTGSAGANGNNEEYGTNLKDAKKQNFENR